jgi:2-oxoglutarate ferredoxin oxidoreductase subunit beta
MGELIEEKFAKQGEFVVVTGIGCHGKTYDYINASAMYGLHGRATPFANGLTLGNPKLKPIVFSGDGDSYAEGMSHFVNAARMNPNYALFIHDNKVFALTTGQITPTTEKGFPGKSTPRGSPFTPLNPIAFALEAGAGFVAREYALDAKNLQDTMKAAIKHRGFAFVDILQPCISFHDFTAYLKDKMYRINGPLKHEDALAKAREWNYSLDPNAKIPLGIFFSEKRPTLDESAECVNWAKKYPERKVRPEIWNDFEVA